MITTVVIMVIGNNLARAFGLVGSMSIIRFRMAIKDTKDIVYIFFTLAIGMASGVGLYTIAVAGTLFISLIMLILSGIDFAAPSRREFLLHFIAESPDGGKAAYLPFLAEMCKKHRLVNIKTIPDSDLVEFSYSVELKKSVSVQDLISRLEQVEDVADVNAFFDEDAF